jgi:hypothetical protein
MLGFGPGFGFGFQMHCHSEYLSWAIQWAQWGDISIGLGLRLGLGLCLRFRLLLSIFGPWTCIPVVL